MRWVLVLAILVVFETRAHASWWYTYSCSGECAPGRLAVSDTIGPFETYAHCDAVRSGDSRRYTNEQSGSLGGLSLCSESDAAPAASSSSSGGRAPPSQSSAVSIVGGPGYLHVADEMSTPKPLAGIDVGATMGGRPWFGLIARTGLRYTEIPVPLTDMTDTALFVPLLLGATVSPGTSRFRAELGADFGLDVAVQCASCASGWLYSLRAGVVVYGRGKKGVSVELVRDIRDGGDVVTGAFLVRVSLRWRNEQLRW